MDSINEFAATVVIPTFNRKVQLRKAIFSILDQNLKEVTIHIFDNCSKDGTEEFVIELCERYPQIRYTKRERNLGALQNYASAIESVETPFYLPLADDDWLLPGSLRVLLDALLEDDSLGAVISQTVGLTLEGDEIHLNPDETWNYQRYESQEFVPLWVSESHFEWSSLMFRTSAMRDVGGPDVATGSPWDVDFQLQLFLRYPVKMIHYRSAIYLMHPGQYSVQADPKRTLGVFRMISKAKNYVSVNTIESQILEQAVDLFSKKWCDRMAAELIHTAKFIDFLKINRCSSEILPYPALRTYFRLRYVFHMLKKAKARMKGFFPKGLTEDRNKPVNGPDH